VTPVRVGPPAGAIGGTVRVPGDKSIAHRALLLGALAEGTTTVRGLPGGADVLSTLGAMRALGARVERDGDAVRIVGCGDALARTGTFALDCGNSGTTMRLGAGLVAGGGASVRLDGDASLRRRPMERIAAPLRAMGATVDTTDGHAPLAIRGGSLAAIDWTLPVASAQVKSAILLAGLRARGTTRVREPLASRDHTERLLGHLGVRVGRTAGVVELDGGQRLRGADVPLPGDPSSAAFLVVAALLVPGSEIRAPDVGVNPTRTGVFALLRRMGGAIDVAGAHEVAGEPHAEVHARASRLHGIAIGPADVPGAIDELPILCVAAAVADGETTIAGAGELRVKESDRIDAIAQLANLGVPVRTTPDGLAITGSGGRPLRGGRIDARDDHRIAMAFAIAGLVADAPVEIAGAGSADVSYPGFFAELARLGVRVEGA
jgi:3-phosphoshikimate 1-carboxyvinyltransferase